MLPDGMFASAAYIFAQQNNYPVHSRRKLVISGVCVCVWRINYKSEGFDKTVSQVILVKKIKSTFYSRKKTD